MCFRAATVTVHVCLCDGLHLLLYIYQLLLHCSYVINVVDTFMCNYDMMNKIFKMCIHNYLLMKVT